MLNLRYLHHENVPNKNSDVLHVKYSHCKYFYHLRFFVRCSIQRLSLKIYLFFLFLLLTGGAPPVKKLKIKKPSQFQLWLFVVRRAEAEAAALSLGFSLSKVLIRFAAQTYFWCLPPPHPPLVPPHHPLSLFLSLLSTLLQMFWIYAFLLKKLH